MRPVTPDLIVARSEYIQRWEWHLAEHFAAVDVAGKRVFVLGGGSGAEALWAVKRGAIEVVSVDPQGADRRPFDMALGMQGLTHLAPRHTPIAGTTISLSPDIGSFDLAVSNNVLEHVFGLSANLAALAPLLSQRGARLFFFIDPLFQSSLGHHLPIGPWEHLTLSQSDVRSRVGPHQWADYRDGLNGMTITDFLGAVREAGMILLDLSVRPDLNADQLRERLVTFPPGRKPMDLALAGVSGTLAFPHNL